MRDVQCRHPRDYCTHILMGQLQIILDRYQGTAGQLPTLDRLLNLIAAPTVYRSLFASAPLPVEELHELIDLALKA
jgi:hypothetical protein